MVRKICQLLFSRWGWFRPPPPTPSLCLILGPRRKVRSKKLFHGRYSKHEPTAKNLVPNSSSSDSREKLEKPVGGNIHPPPPRPGHRRVKLAPLE